MQMQTVQAEHRQVKTIALDSRFASLIKRIMTLDDGVSLITIIKDAGEIRASFTKLGNVEKIGGK